MYYRGDDFGEFAPLPDAPFEYANTPTSEIRKQELEAGQQVAESGFTGGGGFLKQLGEVGATFGTFFSPFLPVLAPALMGTTGIGPALTAASKLKDFSGGALRIIEGTTTGGTTTAPGETSAPFSAPVPPSSTTPPPGLVIYSPNLGPSAGLKRSVLASQLQQARAPRRSRATRRSPALSRAQRAILSREVRRQLLL